MTKTTYPLILPTKSILDLFKFNLKTCSNNLSESHRFNYLTNQILLFRRN